MYVIKARTHGGVRDDSETHSTDVTGLHSRLRRSWHPVTQSRAFHCHFAHSRAFSLYSPRSCITRQDATPVSVNLYWAYKGALWLYIRSLHFFSVFVDEITSKNTPTQNVLSLSYALCTQTWFHLNITKLMMFVKTLVIVLFHTFRYTFSRFVKKVQVRLFTAPWIFARTCNNAVQLFRNDIQHREAVNNWNSIFTDTSHKVPLHYTLWKHRF